MDVYSETWQWLIDENNRRRIALILGVCAAAASGCASERLEIYPEHFRLQVGEIIHYSTLTVGRTSAPVWVKDVELATSNPSCLTMVSPTGVFRAVAPGSADVIVKTRDTRRSFAVQIADEKLPTMTVVRDTLVPRITGDEVLLVGHANRDGFDHTAVARAGIDALVAKFKKRGWPVIYLVSETYPNWYTSDREPTHAVVSEGQEHDLPIDAGRIVFTGGDFTMCLMRNVQFVLHRKLRQGARDPISLVFPLDAIWTGGNNQPFPAPMVTLKTRFDESGSPQRAYEEIIAGFLDRLIHEYPVAGYPRPEFTPSPHLGVLLKDATIEVTIGTDFRQTYRSGSGPRIRMDFCG